ncbi:R3H domain-containing protein 4-like isoform X2 [Lineus longissimus]|uniref:R3H domain-containing protein 4-like isoform X2 n=1 Tax=Lineus longissimus TaxID=88925 RepID=UPI00315DF3F9
MTVKYLLSLVESEDLDEMNIGDFMEPTMSAFAELLAEQEKMKVWNDFVNHTEEEQNFFLQNQQYSDEAAGEVGETSSKPAQDDHDWVHLDDKREAHPAFSADECFQRIDSNLKALLHKRQLPRGVICQLEEQIIMFFKEWPTSVYVSKVPSSFERLLLHAVCQYLDLKSHSFCCQGERQTEVENKHQTFLPPDTALSTYLESKLVLH